MVADLYSIFFAAFRGMSQTHLLIVAGALFTRLQLWTPVGSKEVGAIVAKVMLPAFVFVEFAKPESRDKLKSVFASAEGPLLIGLSTGLMLVYLLLGLIMVRLMKGSSKGMNRAGNLISISVAFGNATALPVLLIKTVTGFLRKRTRSS